MKRIDATSSSRDAAKPPAAGPDRRTGLPTFTWSLAPALLGTLCGAIAEVARWRAQVRGRRQLIELDDRSLRDIGLRHDDAYREWRKPFWRR